MARQTAGGGAAGTLALSLVALLVLVALAANGPTAAGELPAAAPTGKPAAHAIPGGTADDAAMALNRPDEFAWRLFLAINRQALPGEAGAPDPDHPTIGTYQDDAPVVWETWALASGGRAGPVYVPPNRSEVYRDMGAEPAEWDELPRKTPQPKVFEPYPGKGIEFLAKVARAPGKFDPVEDGGEGGIEVRMNRATYDYVRGQNLYSIEGLEQKFREGKELVFPQDAKEVKARWAPISEADKKRYHWRTTKAKDGTEQVWGLTALHIITRDLPNWFWCDFEHVDFERHAEQYSQDATTRGEDPPAGKQGVRRETVGTKWETMRLRGTQTSFVDAQGRPTILANSQIEHGFQQKSSCLTCHARAAIGLRSERADLPGWQTNTMPLNLAVHPVLDEPVGVPDPRWFLDERNRRRYFQTHFLWSPPFRALSTKVKPE